MFYNRKEIQKSIINERINQIESDKMSLNEWMSQGLRNTINNAKAEAAHDARLSWEDMCNPRKSTWTYQLKKAVPYKTGPNGELIDRATGKEVMFGANTNETNGKPDKTASEAMHMCWKSKEFSPDLKLDKEVVKDAFQKSNLQIVWAMEFIAGHLWGTKFAKVNEVKGKPTVDEHGNMSIEGKPVYHVGKLVVPDGWHMAGILKMFTFGEKYVLVQTAFQKFVLCMIKDPKTNRIVNKKSQFKKLSVTPEEEAYNKRRAEETEKRYGWMKNLRKDIEQDYKRRRGEI